MATDKPERPPSKELRRIKSFMQGAKRAPMLSRRAASLMHNRSLDDLSLAGKNHSLDLLYETIEFFYPMAFLRDEKLGGKMPELLMTEITYFLVNNKCVLTACFKKRDFNLIFNSFLGCKSTVF